MIRIQIERSGNGSVRRFDISGHAGFAPEGSDIVCAAISTLGQTAIAALESLTDLEIRYEIDDKEGHLRCEVVLPEDPDSRQAVTAGAIMDAFAIGCKQTATSCGSKYIKIIKRTIK